MTIARPILRFAESRPDAAAIIEAERTITFAELAGLVAQTASYLRAMGLGRGDRIGLALGDTKEQLILLLATASLGAIAAPLDWQASPEENRRFIEGLELAAVVVEPGLRSVTGRIAIPLDAAWRRSVDRAPADQVLDGEWSDDFVISATSGSTGAPKFTVMTHQEHYFALAGALELMDLSGRHRFLCTMPLYYAGGRNSCMMHLLRGDCLVLHPGLVGAEEYFELVKLHAITVAGAVPSFVRQLLASAGNGPALPRMAAFFSTGAPLYADEKQSALRKLTPNFRERYGTAETSAIFILRPEDFGERSASVGRPHSLIRVETVDDDERQTAPGEPGRMRVKGPGVARPLPGAAEASFQNGWFYPGEIARIDEQGFIFLQGRSSEVIFRGGAKIHPAEVEAALLEHPDVLDVAVIGRAGNGRETRVTAFVVARGDVAIGRLIGHCRTRLSPHKVPQEFHLRSAFPLNAAGKVDKAALTKSLTD